MASPKVSEAERVAVTETIHNRELGRGFTFCYFNLGGDFHVGWYPARSYPRPG